MRDAERQEECFHEASWLIDPELVAAVLTPSACGVEPGPCNRLDFAHEAFVCDRRQSGQRVERYCADVGGIPNQTFVSLRERRQRVASKLILWVDHNHDAPLVRWSVGLRPDGRLC